MEYSHFKEHTDRVVESCSRVIVGKEETVRLIFISFLCSGHVLLEDVPGTGKTMLLKAFAKTVGSRFKRIQFTPDLLPSDLTGINFYNQKTGEFQFREGPLFTNIVLADEINRATPRTQSSLLEAMEESPVEAMTAVGAGFWQTMFFARIPQLMPIYSSLSLNHFEIAVRSASTLGLVGAGGIGAPLVFAIQARNWDKVSVILMGVIVAVFAIDSLAGFIRKKLK